MLNEIPLDGLRDRLLAVRAMPWAPFLDDEALTLLAEHARNRSFEAGATLLVEGQPVPSMFLVTAGRVTVTVGDHRLARVEAGHAVGITSLLARDPRGCSAVADVDTRALEIPADALLAAYEESFALVRNVMRLQCRGLLTRRDRLPVPPPGDDPAPLGEPREGELTLVDRVREVRRTPLFATTNLDAVFEVARNTVDRRVGAGEHLWRMGEPSSFWVRIEYGRVRCTNADGRSATVGAGYVLGPLDCWAELPRSYDACAETDLIVHQTDLAAMLGVIETHHDLAMDLIAIMARLNMPSVSST